MLMMLIFSKVGENTCIAEQYKSLMLLSGIGLKKDFVAVSGTGKKMDWS